MALFGLFKSKEEKARDAFAQEVLPYLFPNGQEDELRDQQKVREIVGQRIQQDVFKGFVAGCKARIFLAKEFDEQVQVDSIVARSKGVLDEATAYRVLVYLAGESMFRAKLALLAKQSHGAITPEHKKEIEKSAQVFTTAVTTDVLPGCSGKFGCSVTNPIPTICPVSNDYYLRRLRWQGNPIEFKRTGATPYLRTTAFVDVYEISQGSKVIAKLFLYPYSKKTSCLSPDGFSLDGVQVEQTIIANILDPNTPQRKETWRIGTDISAADAAKFAVQGALYITVLYQNGVPRRIPCTLDQWLDTKRQFAEIESGSAKRTSKLLDLIRGEEKPAFSYSASAMFTHSAPSKPKPAAKPAPPEPLIQNKSGINWTLVLERFTNDGMLNLVGRQRTLEVNAFEFGLMLVFAKLNGWAGGVQLFDVAGNQGTLRKFKDWIWIDGEEALELVSHYYDFIKKYAEGRTKAHDEFDQAFLRICAEGGFRISVVT